jgi:hypothetical protein
VWLVRHLTCPNAKLASPYLIAPVIAAQVQFASDRICCVCRSRGKPIQLHHIDDDPSHNTFANLAVLCFDCHRETQIIGGFDRKLDAEQVTLYRNDWVQLVAESRASIERSKERTLDEQARIASIMSAVERYREHKDYPSLAMLYARLGNAELRDKYVELALKQNPSDENVVFLRGRVQQRPELIPDEVRRRVINRRGLTEVRGSW